MVCEGTKMIKKNLVWQLLLMLHHLFRSFYIVDIRKEAAVDVNVDSRVSRTLPFVLVVVIVIRHVFEAIYKYFLKIFY